MTSAEKLAYAGEQVICFLEEITKLPCPRCGESSLSVTIVGGNVIVRCSEALADYMALDPSEPNIGVCSFAQVIKKVILNSDPFNWANKKGRPTRKNINKVRRTRRAE